MASHVDLINLSNATHNGTSIPNGWKLLPDSRSGKTDPISFGPITTQAYKGPNNEIVLAIKGTDGQLADWTQINQAFLSGDYPQAIQDLVTYAHNLNKTAEGAGLPISVTGFSQGGGLSQLLSHTFGWNGNAQNAPGAANLIENPAYKQQLETLETEAKGVGDNFMTIIEKGDVVDNFGNHLGPQPVEVDLIPNSFAECLIVAATSGPLLSLAIIATCLGVKASNQHDIQKLTDIINNMSVEERSDLLHQIDGLKLESGMKVEPLSFNEWLNATGQEHPKLSDNGEAQHDGLNPEEEALAQARELQEKYEEYIEKQETQKIKKIEEIEEKQLSDQEQNGGTIGSTIGSNVYNLFISGQNEWSDDWGEQLLGQSAFQTLGQNVGEWMATEANTAVFADIGSDFTGNLESNFDSFLTAELTQHLGQSDLGDSGAAGAEIINTVVDASVNYAVGTTVDIATPCSFFVMRQKTNQKNAPQMSANGFSNSLSLSEGKLAEKLHSAQTSHHFNRSRLKTKNVFIFGEATSLKITAFELPKAGKISLASIRGMDSMLNAA
jgi:hypothetical protein